jgi:hypothetical protein
MRDLSALVESSAATPSSTRPLPDADTVFVAWADLPPAGGFPARPDKAKSVSRAMLALGAGLLLLVPLGGALFLAAGVLGLAIASETPVPQSSSSADQNRTASAVPTTATGPVAQSVNTTPAYPAGNPQIGRDHKG